MTVGAVKEQSPGNPTIDVQLKLTETIVLRAACSSSKMG